MEKYSTDLAILQKLATQTFLMGNQEKVVAVEAALGAFQLCRQAAQGEPRKIGSELG